MFLISMLRKEKKIDGDLLWLVIEYYCSTYVIYVFITAVTSSIVVVFITAVTSSIVVVYLLSIW